MRRWIQKMGRAFPLLCLSVLAVTSVAFATDGEGGADMSSLNSAVTTALGQVQSNAMSLIGSVLPYALGIMGAVLVVTIGLKVFKKVTGKS